MAVLFFFLRSLSHLTIIVRLGYRSYNRLSNIPPTSPTRDDVLLPFEQQNMPLEYMEYYGYKRNNFFASIQKFR